VQRWSETTAANRASSSTKIGCPYPLKIRLQLVLTDHCGRVTADRGAELPVCQSNGDICAACERVTQYQPKATVGYQSAPWAAT
jgi:hypothetical protein